MRDARHRSPKVNALDQLAIAFLLCEKTNIAAQLEDFPAMRYLFYLCQIHISLSSVSYASSQTTSYTQRTVTYHPLRDLLDQGLLLSLNTQYPLLSHSTLNPLIEEYTVGTHTIKLSTVDCLEMLFNSVLYCSWEDREKHILLGKEKESREIENKIENELYYLFLSSVRLKYRFETLAAELCLYYS
mmetsp:Transcript_6985/g.7235  ORF Transcript_6985/g.7235 Transcript_6985/m.7235 type:complete len:186 (+) Transcript_6985:96-653(+)